MAYKEAQERVKYLKGSDCGVNLNLTQSGTRTVHQM